MDAGVLRIRQARRCGGAKGAESVALMQAGLGAGNDAHVVTPFLCPYFCRSAAVYAAGPIAKFEFDI